MAMAPLSIERPRLSLVENSNFMKFSNSSRLSFSHSLAVAAVQIFHLLMAMSCELGVSMCSYGDRSCVGLWRTGGRGGGRRSRRCSISFNLIIISAIVAFYYTSETTVVPQYIAHYQLWTALRLEKAGNEQQEPYGASLRHHAALQAKYLSDIAPLFCVVDTLMDSGVNSYP